MSTIARCAQVYKTHHAQKAITDIRNAISLIIGAPIGLPLHSSTSLNLDFFDNNRTRYYRLQPDLIALEALGLMCDDKRTYLKAEPGSLLLDNLLTILKDPNLAYDTYGSKMSFSTCLDCCKCLMFLHTKNERAIGRARAGLATFMLFRLYIKKDIVLFLLGVLLSILSFLWLKPLIGPSLMLIITKCVDICWPGFTRRKGL